MEAMTRRPVARRQQEAMLQVEGLRGGVEGRLRGRLLRGRCSAGRAGGGRPSPPPRAAQDDGGAGG